jgi:hypothetical protein
VTFFSKLRWFKTKWAAWQKLFHQWQRKQMEYRSKVQKNATEKAPLWPQQRFWMVDGELR